jgi:hypothetical protein
MPSHRREQDGDGAAHDADAEIEQAELARHDPDIHRDLARQVVERGLARAVAGLGPIARPRRRLVGRQRQGGDVEEEQQGLVRLPPPDRVG